MLVPLFFRKEGKLEPTVAGQGWGSLVEI